MLLPYSAKAIPGSDGPPIVTSLTEAEGNLLHQICKDKDVLEIGALLGYSTCVIGTVCKSLISIDPHTGAPGVWDPTYPACLANATAHGITDRATLVVGYSQELVPTMAPDSFDVVWVDADHGYDAVLRDARLAYRVVRSHGTLLFHDYGEDVCPGVRPALDLFTEEIEIIPVITDTVAMFCLP